MQNQTFESVSKIQEASFLWPVAIVGLATLALYNFHEKSRLLILFAWVCFFKPLNKNSKNHQSNLEAFYSTQASIYDSTREILLQGRVEALKLCFAHAPKNRKLVWIDIGGGTGLNIEKMDKYVTSIQKSFKAVYLIDLLLSLCKIAEERVARNRWKNVHIVCSDACDFKIPYDQADLITFSYSLLMIPPYYSAIDHAASLLAKSDGVICSIDFGVQSKANAIGRINTLGGQVNRHIPWLFRTFWRIWFEFDKVFLDPSRREYLEYRFGTIKSLNCYNRHLGKIPYYIWLGTSKTGDSQLLNRINSLATELPYLAPIDNKEAPISKALEAAIENSRKGLPYPSLFYQKEVWRVYYDELSEYYHQFKNQYIYAFTWEDPREDARILNLTSKDTVLAITSAGDNILSYASLPSPPRRIHGVDLNPCQGHLTELKLASLRALTYEENWKLFGDGKVDNFSDLLILKISPHISSNALQYWSDKGPKTFTDGLYDTGSTRWALRLAKWVFKITGLSGEITKLCNASTLTEQTKIWESSIRPVLFSFVVGRVFVGNPIFLWKALGVPANQAAMMGDSIIQYIIDTLDPIVKRSLISDDNYFYYLTLKGCYSRDNCPDYLTKSGFKNLKNTKLDGIRLHTDTLNDVFARLTKKTISVAVIMDHMDWFDPKGTEVDSEIEAIYGALSNNGRVLLRSAAKVPWYIKNFEAKNFSCVAAGTRVSGTSIDRVNMYASTWVCTKVVKERQMSNLEI